MALGTEASKRLSGVVVVPSSSTYRLLIERGYPIPYVDELAQGRLRQLLKLGGSIGYLSRYVDNVDLFLYLVDEGVEVNYAVAVILTSDHDELLEKMVARRPSTKRVRRELEKMEMDEEFIDGAISRLEEHLQ